MKNFQKKTLIFSLTKKDFIIRTGPSGGPGGQHANKVETAVTITHPPSGAMGQSKDTKSQVKNKRLAFRRMANSPKFQSWIKVETARRSGELDRRVDELMAEELLKIEYGEAALNV